MVTPVRYDRRFESSRMGIIGIRGQGKRDIERGAPMRGSATRLVHFLIAVVSLYYLKINCIEYGSKYGTTEERKAK